MLKIEAAAGNLVKPEQAPPESLGALHDRGQLGLIDLVAAHQE